MVDFMYVAISTLIFPYWKIRPEPPVQSIPFIMLSLLYIAWRILAGETLPMDEVTIATLAFGLWIVGSLAWTETHQSRFEVFIWLSCLTLFTAARTLPLEMVAWCVFAPGVVLAALQLYRKLWCWKTKTAIGTFDMVVFGNNNHNAPVLMTALFSGLMLDNMLLWPFLMIIGTAIGMTRCRGAIMATIIALLTYGIIIESYYVLIFPALFAVVFAYKKIKGMKGFGVRSSYGADRSLDYGDRPLIYMIALECITRKPIFGWGLNMYRKLMPEVMPSVIHNAFARKILKVLGTEVRADRVHNDHLEIICELGIVGYLLLLFLIGQVVMTPVVMCFLIAFALDACFFFPLREPHTAIPFWALAGAATIATPLHWGILQVAALLLLAAVATQVFLKAISYVYFSQMERAKEEKDKRTALKSAMKYDPLNGHFLSDAAYYFRDSVEGLEYALKGIMNYDGNRVLWGAWDQLSRLLICNDIPKIAEWATDRSLSYNPEFIPAHEIKKLLGDIRIMGSPDYKPDGQA